MHLGYGARSWRVQSNKEYWRVEYYCMAVEGMEDCTDYSTLETGAAYQDGDFIYTNKLDEHRVTCPADAVLTGWKYQYTSGHDKISLLQEGMFPTVVKAVPKKQNKRNKRKKTKETQQNK